MGFSAAPALLVAAFIVGGLVGGIVTPTEAGVSACVAAFFVSGICYRNLSLSSSIRSLKSACNTTVTIWAIIAVRNLPVAPYTVVNAVAGATNIKLRDFVVALKNKAANSPSKAGSTSALGESEVDISGESEEESSIDGGSRSGSIGLDLEEPDGHDSNSGTAIRRRSRE